MTLILGIAAALGGHPHDFRGFAQALQARSPIALQPRWLQGIEALLLADLVGYWVHRLFHRRPLWRFHAIHHSAQTLDWLAATRLHPVNDMLNRALTILPLLFLGFQLDVLASVTPLLTFWAIFIHADLDWDLGPLRLVVVSPRFHRWHHTSEEEGLDRNFAGLFPVIDVIFGTCHMPRDRVPRRFGLHNETVPAGLIGQLAYPFTGSRRAP
ncbi:MAG TPA: sterol desaturase family protein [Stellaceae bacterium]|nr:sterol desaturase family protein [Stellaceae bacterium]